MELRLNQKEGVQYLEDLIKLFSKFKKEVPNNTFHKKINPYLTTLLFQLNTNITESLKINPTTRLPTFNEFSRIFAQKTIIDKKKEGTLTFEEIREKLINDFDSKNPEFLFQNHLASLANSLNISQVEQIKTGLGIKTETEVLEIGHKTDLVEIKVDGYSPANQTFLEYIINIYVPNKITKKIKKLFETGKIINESQWFGQRSDEIYELYRSEEKIEQVRSIERKIIGGNITPQTQVTQHLAQYNPRLQQIIENSRKQNIDLNAIFYHEDKSTPNFFDENNSGLPNIEVEHRYITIDEESKNYLQTQVNNEQVI